MFIEKSYPKELWSRVEIDGPLRHEFSSFLETLLLATPGVIAASAGASAAER
jgi:hypothetical protein